jgi:hypothetical protein
LLVIRSWSLSPQRTRRITEVRSGWSEDLLRFSFVFCSSCRSSRVFSGRRSLYLRDPRVLCGEIVKPTTTPNGQDYRAPNEARFRKLARIWRPPVVMMDSGGTALPDWCSRCRMAWISSARRLRWPGPRDQPERVSLYDRE